MIHDAMAHKVNLDALIVREDFEITSSHQENEKLVFSLGELEMNKGTFRLLRKPVFQRATNDWTPQQVVDLVKCFMDRDLIPAIIIWHSPSSLYFVMDGAHRLSALIAWVNNDYGDGPISQRRRGSEPISKAQKDAHKVTEELIAAQVGSYQHLMKVSVEDNFGSVEDRDRARGMSSRQIIIQDYHKADAKKAEASFYRINQGGTSLNDDEREIIRTRRRPESIATRCVLRAGGKEQYALGFDPEVNATIQKLAGEVSALLFLPETNHKDLILKLPLIGASTENSTMGAVDQFIHLANSLPERVKPKNAFEALDNSDPRNDLTGDKTIEYLKKARKLAALIASKEKHSIGFHPGIYTYSKAGKFLPGAFFAQVMFAQWLTEQDKDRLFEFIPHRQAFEEFLFNHKDHLSTLSHDVGSRMKSAPAILRYWLFILEQIKAGLDPLESMQDHKDYAHLALLPEQALPAKTKVSKGASFALKLRTTLDRAPPCPQCGARIYEGAWQHGHDTGAAEGGSGHSNNLDPEHPYCNTGYKTRKEHKAKLAALPHAEVLA